ncbi:RraA family protein [Nocardioides ungokensis]
MTGSERGGQGCWSSTTADGKMRRASASWSCWRHKRQGVGAVMVWGRHRDTPELTQIALPVFSYGRYPAGPVRLDEQEPSALVSARFGACLVTRDDIVFGDDDGVVFVAASQAGEVLAAARQIGEVERDQARKIQAGQTLRQQTAFSEYLARRAAEPSYTFRRHLRRIGGAIEE